MASDNVFIAPVLKYFEVRRHLRYESMLVNLCRKPDMYFHSGMYQQHKSITGNKLYSILFIVNTVEQLGNFKLTAQKKFSFLHAMNLFYHLDLELTRSVGRDRQSK